MVRFLKSWIRNAPAIVGVVLLVGAIWVVRSEFRHLKIEDIAKAIHAVPLPALVRAGIFTVLAYGVLTLYDFLGTIYAGRKVPYSRVAFASFCAYALSHNLGFSALSGAAVRYRLYALWGLTPSQIGKLVAFCSLTFGLGGMVLGAIILFFEPTAVPLIGTRFPVQLLHAFGAILIGIVIAYITVARVVRRFQLFGHAIELPGIRMAILQVLLATADVAVTAAIFYALLPEGRDLTFLRFLAVYVVAYSAGLAATLPGGIGVFDSAMLLGLAPYVAPPAAVSAILIFRLYYYVIPLFLAATLFASNEVLLRARPLLYPAGSPAALPAASRWSEPDLAVAAATGTVALCGALLLSLGVLSTQPDFSWLGHDIRLVAREAGQFIPSLLGAALLVLAIGLSRRVTLAWWTTIVLLLVAAAFSLARGDSPLISAILALATFVIAPYRNAFYRHTRLFSGPLDVSSALSLLALTVCVAALAIFERHVRGVSAVSWWQLVLSPKVPNSLRASVFLAVAVGLTAIWRLILPGRVRWEAWGPEVQRRYVALGGDPPARVDGVVWGESGQAGIAFRREGRILLGLGDPVGDKSDQISAIWRFRDLAEQEGGHAAVYGASEELLQVYADIGLAALPLGPDGLPMPEEGREMVPKSNQYLVCHAERDLPQLLPILNKLPSKSGITQAHGRTTKSTAYDNDGPKPKHGQLP
ncbi:MAG: phosphatidylglycerol lysyltransferase domain-containing protein [Acidobacteriia bacterium]|nr:lysylphosphatidylglycerol synthetase family protein [Methyloceanibacter sp.]MCL6491397.1 phosphatidylglycerol lysyltransferase domain-containing protein [Terriglobia bacterium]